MTSAITVTSGIDKLMKTGDPIRDKSRQLLEDALRTGGMPAEVEGKDLAALSAEIEQAVFEANHNETHNDYRHCIRSRILNLKDKNNPLLSIAILTREISPVEFAHMTSEEMASPQRKQENIRLRRNSLTQAVGINDRRPIHMEDENIPGESGMGEMERSGQPGLEFQRPV